MWQIGLCFVIDKGLGCCLAIYYMCVYHMDFWDSNPTGHGIIMYQVILCFISRIEWPTNKYFCVEYPGGHKIEVFFPVN